MQLNLTVPIIPIGVFGDSSKIKIVAEILLQHGINCIEVTLRTPQALECIAAIRKSFPDMLVGAGSIVTDEDFHTAVNAGAMFIVSPCVSDSLMELSQSYNTIPYIPGFTTPSELANALTSGMRYCKFFPAEYCGGASYLKAVLEPFVNFSFSVIPTGGIMPSLIKSYLDIPHVYACGLSYIVDSKLIDKNDYKELEHRIKETLSHIAR